MLRSNRTLKTTIIVLIVLASVWIGSQLSTAGGTILGEAQKIVGIISLIQQVYVESPDLDKLTEGAIEGILKRLDPHSIYIPPVEQEKIDEVDHGEFEGIGISFMIQNELITVIAPIPGTPSERLGIRSGDKIIEIDNISAYGITNDEVFKKLRGPAGSTVNIKVARTGVSQPLDFTIVRDKIPIRSVIAGFMLDDSTGYLLLNQFTATSGIELDTTLAKLEAAGMTRLIFDLRNNQGGRLSKAVEIADMLIPGGHVLVSRLGRNPEDNEVYYSTDQGTHTLFNLIVLINNGSASASEIIAGAVQDLDRGLVVGENSFGKGLVQHPYALKDGGVIRLSTAHWYTPSGRLVQRPYDKGRGEYYAIRYKDPDSTETGEREAFETLGGRTVYASSGITPDEKIEDQRITRATIQLLNKRVPFKFAQNYVKQHQLSENDDFEAFNRDFVISDNDLNDLIEFAKADSIEYPQLALEEDGDYLKTQIKAEIAQAVWSIREYYYLIRTSGDPAVKRSQELFIEADKVSALWHSDHKG